MADNDKTHLYGEDTNDKTGTYNSEDADAGKTGTYNSEEEKIKKTSQGISIGDKINIRNNEYIVMKVLSEESGEANVYQIEDVSGNKYALKLYFEFKSEAEEPNGVALERILNLVDPDILSLIDYGIGNEKYNDKYCYEISDLAAGGNILDVADFKNKYTPDFIEKKIIPQLFLAITKLHEYKIYHCDLKPSNILFKDKEQSDIILGDYGSAKAYDLKSEKSLRKSTTIKGTEFYLPPEQARGIVSEKNDYYSFGMILLHLTYPESLTTDNYREIDKDKFEQIVERQYNLKPIIEFNPALKRLNTLIEGLTLINHINRWGSDEIKKWLDGEDMEVAYHSNEAPEAEPLVIGPLVISSAEEFINYINSKSTWFEDLFEDPDVYKLIKDWLDRYIGIPDRKRFDKVVSIYKLSGKLILNAAITLFLLPQKPLKFENQSFDFFNTENISETVSGYIALIDSIYQTSTAERLNLYFFQLEYTLKSLHYIHPESKAILALINKLYNYIPDFKQLPEEFDFKTLLPAQIIPAKGKCDYEFMIKIFYAFNEKRAYPDNEDKPIETSEELALFYLKNKNFYDNKFHVFERNVLLKNLSLHHLVGLKLPELASGILSNYAETIINIEHISFEKTCNVHYSAGISLDGYLKQNGINEAIPQNKELVFIYAEKNKLSSNSAAKSFIEYLKTNHKTMNISAESMENARRTFIKEHKKYFLVNNIVMAVSAVLIIVIIAAIFAKL
ncbi:MAG TPA: protein kinase [Bacteroidales bacterium]|nr:protein kinase [Bacteroidales bacterium]